MKAVFSGVVDLTPNKPLSKKILLAFFQRNQRDSKGITFQRTMIPIWDIPNMLEAKTERDKTVCQYFRSRGVAGVDMQQAWQACTTGLLRMSLGKPSGVKFFAIDDILDDVESGQEIADRAGIKHSFRGGLIHAPHRKL